MPYHQVHCIMMPMQRIDSFWLLKTKARRTTALTVLPSPFERVRGLATQGPKLVPCNSGHRREQHGAPSKDSPRGQSGLLPWQRTLLLVRLPRAPPHRCFELWALQALSQRRLDCAPGQQGPYLCDGRSRS